MAGAAVFRADASPQIGIGHVMRCLALAQAWQDVGGSVSFVLSGGVPAVEARLRSEGCKVRQVSSPSGSLKDAAEVAEAVSDTGAEWLVVDGYNFGLPYLERLKSGSASIVLIDDYGKLPRYDVEVILNPNVYARAEMYQRCVVGGHLLLGAQHALLRREFRKRGPVKVVAPPVARKVLVTMGGSDPENVTLRVLEAISRLAIDGLEITIISGTASPHHHVLRRAVQSSRHPARLLIDVSDMPAVFRSVDAVISAAGGTCAEVATCGIPMLLVIIAENHVRNAEEYAAQQLALSIGWYSKLTPETMGKAIEGFLGNSDIRDRVAKNALALIDGQGAGRVVDVMLKHTIATGT